MCLGVLLTLRFNVLMLCTGLLYPYEARLSSQRIGPLWKKSRLHKRDDPVILQSSFSYIVWKKIEVT